MLRLSVLIFVACFCTRGALAGQRLEQIRERGYLVCGVAPQDPGFSESVQAGQFIGFEVDLCRAVAAAVLGTGPRVRFHPVQTVHELLADTRIDLVFHRLTWTLTREAPGQLEFGPIYFYEQLAGHPLEPLAPLLRSDDVDFARIVRWSIFALVDAEQRGLDQASALQANDFPDWPPVSTGAALGLSPDWARHMVAETGNYGEIFERNLGPASLQHLPRGPNRLWRDGGLLLPPLLQ
jgi:ABC-type amino acid transport substrate-binding protein